MSTFNYDQIIKLLAIGIDNRLAGKHSNADITNIHQAFVATQQIFQEHSAGIKAQPPAPKPIADEAKTVAKAPLKLKPLKSKNR